MHIVEKVDNLILITLEGDVNAKDISTVKKKIEEIAEVPNDDVIVSLNLAAIKSTKAAEIENRKNELLKHCHLSGLRVYSYRFD
ncbi:MAG: hypothetical protein KAW12_06255 [Candidatus Aminicenantes bacterium]|nr:hypothetical protein [Candidatus Aminicenantes bacterium]